MSAFDRAIGLARSVALYYAIPGRQRRLRTLYGQFVRNGDLVFDIGAHLGNRTRAFAALGCRVVAVEPQPHVARVLRRLVGGRPNVRVVECAVTRTPGRATLAVSERTPTVSSLASEWRDARAKDPDFADVSWNQTFDVAATTLDTLIQEHGRPAFVKIDVEGAELDVLQGLSCTVPTVSFEFLPQAMEAAGACCERLAALGPYRFNWSLAESSRLVSREWMDGPTLVKALRAAAPRRHGDIYARLRPRERAGNQTLP
jgi:FkbM family methyltransferase